ncbi:unnamed protein product [Owenia fusiformis]|uniref:WDR59/RTC1-like RING zinc finger domain-containing protein n=1 Tax=Owenia fusiformis TaxID=6347 RepID=A0A8S4P369_OWEFU|nr:unnamed protein product [Owenia fusiformis]
MVSSSLSVHELCEQEFSMDWFIETALKYKLSGRSLSELCDHNTAVAKSLQRHQIAQTWQMVKLFFAEVPITPAQTRTASVMANANDAHKSIDDRSKGSLNGSHLQDNKTINAVPEHQTGDTSTGISDESDIDDSETEKNLTSIASGLTNQHGDFFFGDGEVDQTTFEDETLANLESNREWSKLPNEAFQPRHEIIDRTSSPDHLQHTEEPSSGNNDSDSNTQQMEIQEFGNNQKILQAPPFISTLHSWKFVDNVKKILHYYAEQSDVQMSVSLLVVLGDKIRDHIDELTQEHWFISYIELLSRFKLYTVANEVIKLSNHASVSVLNQESTTIHTNCNNCSKSLLRSGWVCDRCKKITNTCSICHLVVKGLYVWCQGCSHGGHIQHIKDWFSRSRNCPTGCGHLCEFT